MRPVIGICCSSQLLKNDQYDPFPINYSPRGFSQAVQLAGGLPLLIPISPEQDAADYIHLLDGLILAG